MEDVMIMTGVGQIRMAIARRCLAKGAKVRICMCIR